MLFSDALLRTLSFAIYNFDLAPILLIKINFLSGQNHNKNNISRGQKKTFLHCTVAEQSCVTHDVVLQ